MSFKTQSYSISKLKVVISLDRCIFPKRIHDQAIYFKRYGDQDANSSTGEFREWKGELNNDSLTQEKVGRRRSNEIIRYVLFIKRYGIWYSELVWSTRRHDWWHRVEDFMLRFFSEKAVPLYAVLLEGGSWDEEHQNCHSSAEN